MKAFQIACLMGAALFFGRASVYMVDLQAKPLPVWIGHGCEGAGGDLWAMDLSDFPSRCKELERY